MSELELAPFISYNPMTVSEETPLSDLVRMLEDYGFHHWPVVDDDHQLVGIVSDLDILKAFQPSLSEASGDDCQRERSRAGAGLESNTCVVERVAAGRTAGEVMSRRLVTVEQGEPMKTALRRMVSNRIHSLPVLEEQRLVGMITSTDFLREFSYGQLQLSHHCVTEFMSSAAEPIELTATLDDAMAAMRDAGMETVAVVQDGCPLGVLSRRQLRTIKCRQAVTGAESAATRFEPYKLSQVARLLCDTPTLRPGQRMLDAAAIMLDHRQHALAVVNQAHRLLGVVSEEDILRTMLEG